MIIFLLQWHLRILSPPRKASTCGGWIETLGDGRGALSVTLIISPLILVVWILIIVHHWKRVERLLLLISAWFFIKRIKNFLVANNDTTQQLQHIKLHLI